MADLGDAPLYGAGITDDRGELLYLPQIMERTGLAEGTVRSRFHAGTMPLWKLGRRLVIWERDLLAWLDGERERTSKAKPPAESSMTMADLRRAYDG